MRTMRSQTTRPSAPKARGGGRAALTKALRWPEGGGEQLEAKVEAIQAELSVAGQGEPKRAPYPPIEAGAKAWGLLP